MNSANLADGKGAMRRVVICQTEGRRDRFGDIGALLDTQNSALFILGNPVSSHDKNALRIERLVSNEFASYFIPRWGHKS
ncbi:hypothetical protein TcasGA2_TC000698 [Tribolium castaneum]|uniref:Uncharacterized protein n=1 Tax=Tribolium castaneum TaxID=7070 RepID=D6W8U6_TRICA|nr:hypothetical protein TcasGA2_TC000698 [Tribolium castaneum]